MTFAQQLFNMLNYIFRFCEKKMPHQIIEYSSNLETKVDMDGLVAALHNRAADLEPLPLAGLRTRAFSSTHFRVADSDPNNAYIAVYLRIAKGRDEDTRTTIGQTLHECLCDYVKEISDRDPIALSYEIQEIEPSARWNTNNLREHLARR